MFSAIMRCSGTNHRLIEAEILLRSLLRHCGILGCLFGLVMILN